MPTFAPSTERPTDVAVDVLVLPVFEGPEPGPGVSDVKGLDLMALYGASGASGKAGEFLLVPNTGVKGLAATSVLLVGIGKRAEADADTCRRAIGRVAGQLAKRKSVATTLPQVAGDVVRATQATVEGVLLGSYRFGRYKSNDDGAGTQAREGDDPGSRQARREGPQGRHEAGAGHRRVAGLGPRSGEHPRPGSPAGRAREAGAGDGEAGGADLPDLVRRGAEEGRVRWHRRRGTGQRSPAADDRAPLRGRRIGPRRSDSPARGSRSTRAACRSRTPRGWSG